MFIKGLFGSKNAFVKLIVCLSIAFLLTLIFTNFVNTTYSENDDSGMQMISEGTITGSPNPYLYLTSTKIGSVLKRLYNFQRDLNWYFLYLLGTYSIFLGFSFFYVALTKSKNLISKYFLLIVFFFISLAKIQFTTISILLAFLSFLYFLQYINEKKIFLSVCIASFLLILAGLIRIETLAVFLFIFIPVLVFRSIKRARVLPLSLCLMIYAMLLINNTLEKNEMTKIVGFDINRFVKSTEIIADNPNYITKQDLSRHGFNSNDLYLIKSFFFIDTDIFSYNKLNNLAYRKSSSHTLLEILKTFVFTIYSNWMCIIPLIALLFMLKMRKNKLDRQILFALCTFLSLVLIVFSRFPHYVSKAIILILLFFLTIESDSFKLKKLGLLVIIGSSMVYINALSVENLDSRQKLLEYFQFFDNNPTRLFQLSPFTDIPIEAISMPKSILYNKTSNYLWLGWLVGTPAYFEHIEMMYNKGLMVSKNQFIHLINDEKTFLLSNNEKFNHSIEKFALKHYNMRIDLILVDSVFETKVNQIQKISLYID